MKSAGYRIFCCEGCGALLCVCHGCDRGQRYCPSNDCGKRARQQALRRYRARYQKTLRGGRLHAARQAAYRQRKAEQKKVTDHALTSSATVPMLSSVPAAILLAGQEDKNAAIECHITSRQQRYQGFGNRCVWPRPGQKSRRDSDYASSSNEPLHKRCSSNCNPPGSKHRPWFGSSWE